MGEVVPFLFEDEHLVRVVALDDEPWFVGRDVCRVLGIKNESHALERLDDDERRDGFAISDPSGPERVANDDPSGPKTGRGYVTVVSEPGVFRLIFTSRKPEAERFKRWLAHEVLPTLRKTGSFTVKHEPALSPESRPFPDWPMEELRTKRGVTDMYRMLYGVQAAQWIAPQLGFPSPSPELVERGRQLTLTLSVSGEAA